ncbi:MAG: aminopeptidase [Candidatus Diapherotrites archaeon]|nr:aminopeptidase [Candidatus Diapherotrites archaeon]
MKLMDAARNAVALAKPKKKERLLVVTDRASLAIGKAIYEAAKQKCSAEIIVIKQTGGHGREPPKAVAAAMKKVDIVYCPTKYSLTHTNASRAAKKSGATVITLPGITRAVFLRGVGVDYKKVRRLTKRVGDGLHKAKKVRIVASGTDIVIDVRGCRRADDGGDFPRKSIHNLPSGEAAVAPRGADGFFTAKDLHLTKKQVKIVVKGRKVVGVSNSRLKRHLWKVRNARNIAELGIGTNPGAKSTDNTLEAEKVLGTCHIAVGDSKSLGGSVGAEIHWDFIIRKPTIWFDNKKIMDKGKLL